MNRREQILKVEFEETAADWLMRRRVGLSAAEEAELAAWLRDDRHAAAFAGAEATWAVLNAPRQAGQAQALARELATREKNRRQRWRTSVYAASGLAAAAMLVLIFGDFGRKQFSTPAPVTVVARPDRQTLPDGSVVELNAGAEIVVAYEPGTRAVRLVRGEALFQVTKDANRPFIVTAGTVKVRAVGTAFTVRNVQDEVGVLVTEGRVAVAREVPDALTAEPTYLDAGDKLLVKADVPTTATSVSRAVDPKELAEALAWRGQRMEFTGTPVAEAVDLFNRVNRTQLVLGDETVGRLQLSGIFWADDPEGFARLLEHGMDVTVLRGDGQIVLKKP